MKYMLPVLLTGCTTNLVLPVAQPNLQTINLGQPNCHMDCHTTQTATQSIGPGDVQGASVSNAISTERNIASQPK